MTARQDTKERRMPTPRPWPTFAKRARDYALIEAKIIENDVKRALEEYENPRGVNARKIQRILEKVQLSTRSILAELHSVESPPMNGDESFSWRLWLEALEDLTTESATANKLIKARLAELEGKG